MVGPVSSSRQYKYKKPSSFNFVSVIMLLALVAGVYGAWKFGPVYYNRYKVDEILRGIDTERNQLAVYFDDAYASLHADYVVVVRHPGGKRTTMSMHRSVGVPE
jgi:hypothetical protein